MSAFSSPSNSIDSIKIDGYLGCDGDGPQKGETFASQSPLEYEYDGKLFIGHYKQTWCNGHASVNHLFISQSDGTHTAIMNAHGDNDEVKFAHGQGFVYYLLWFGLRANEKDGYEYQKWHFQLVMESLVQSCVRDATTAGDGVDIALNKASSSWVKGNGNDSGYAFDGIPSHWLYLQPTQWLQVDLGALYQLVAVEIDWNMSPHYNIQSSQNGEIWDFLEHVTHTPLNGVIHTPIDILGQYIRITVNAVQGSYDLPRIYAMRVYGDRLIQTHLGGFRVIDVARGKTSTASSTEKHRKGHPLLLPGS